MCVLGKSVSARTAGYATQLRGAGPTGRSRDAHVLWASACLITTPASSCAHLCQQSTILDMYKCKARLGAREGVPAEGTWRSGAPCSCAPLATSAPNPRPSHDYRLDAHRVARSAIIALQQSQWLALTRVRVHN